MTPTEQDKELRENVTKCFTDTEMQHDDELTYFDTDQTIDNLMKLIEDVVRDRMTEVVNELPPTIISVPTANYKVERQVISQVLVDRDVLLERITGAQSR